MEERINHPVCERANDLVSFLYHEVDEREAQDFERHLTQCAECARELAQFRGIRDGVIAWRRESLGVLPVRADLRSSAVFGYSEKPSALVAIRRFFDLSPLWLKGAVAFAGILFCVATVFMVSKLQQKPETPLVTDKVYSEQDLKAKVDKEVQARLQQLNATPQNAVQQNAVKETQPRLVVVQNETPGKRNTKEAVIAGRTRRAPLTRAEREQLAADLRLISTSEDSDLNLLEEVNR